MRKKGLIIGIGVAVAILGGLYALGLNAESKSADNQGQAPEAASQPKQPAQEQSPGPAQQPPEQPNVMPQGTVTYMLRVDTAGAWSGSILDSDLTSGSVDGYGQGIEVFTCNPGGQYSIVVQSQDADQDLTAKVVKVTTGTKDNPGPIETLKEASTSTDYGVVSVAGEC